MVTLAFRKRRKEDMDSTTTNFDGYNKCCWLPFLVQGLPVRSPVQEILDLILDMNCLLNTEIYDDARDLSRERT